jgi:RNA polymerase subunit RPABC4/transcription elongation factor Spt4
MKKQSIKFHLKPYSIHQKRMTTINHAFASAIAPVDKYDEDKLTAALQLLEQNPSDLSCVYCGSQADTWDHLIGLVKNGELRGYGHQLGNLVPCCRHCNSKKGAKNWREHLQGMIPDDSALIAKRSQLIDSYLGQYAARVNTGRAAELRPDEWKRYGEIKEKIFELMKEADNIAKNLRDVVVSR